MLSEDGSELKRSWIDNIQNASVINGYEMKMKKHTRARGAHHLSLQHGPEPVVEPEGDGRALLGRELGPPQPLHLLQVREGHAPLRGLVGHAQKYDPVIDDIVKLMPVDKIKLIVY
jgi:hypothetical protein